MRNLDGSNGKTLWDDLNHIMTGYLRGVEVKDMKGEQNLIGLAILRKIVNFLPLIGTKTATLADIWKQLGGLTEDFPNSTDSIADAGKLQELANVLQVKGNSIITLRRKIAVTPEELAILTVNGKHKQLFH